MNAPPSGLASGLASGLRKPEEAAEPRQPQRDWAQERLLRCAGPAFLLGGEPVRIIAPDHTHLHVVWARYGPRAAPLDCTAKVQALVRGNGLDTSRCTDIVQALQLDPSVQGIEHQFVCAYRAEVCFSADDEEWVQLTTYAPCKLSFQREASVYSPGTKNQLHDQEWKSLEHFYQASKFECPDVQGDIREADTAEDAHATGCDRQFEEKMRKDWVARRDEVMYAGLRAKFYGCQKSRNVLQKTGGLPIIWQDPSDDYWGTGRKKDGLNRLGNMLHEVYRELNLPEFVPKELFFGSGDVEFVHSDFTCDNFLRRLTAKTIDRRRLDRSIRDSSDNFEVLYRNSIELLEMHERRAAQTMRHRAKHTMQCSDKFQEEHSQWMGVLEELDQGLGKLERQLAHVERATVNTGEMLAVMDREISRAEDASRVIEDFDAFCDLKSTDMKEMVKLLDLLHARRLEREMDRMRELEDHLGEDGQDLNQRRREAGDEDREDGAQGEDGEGSEEEEDEDRTYVEDPDDTISELSRKLGNWPYHVIPEAYKDVPRARGNALPCVADLGRLMGLVKDWGSKGGSSLVEKGRSNVMDYDTFIANALVKMCLEWHDGFAKAVRKHEATLAAALVSDSLIGRTGVRPRNRRLRRLTRIYLRPMQKVTELLVTLGHGHRFHTQYVQYVFAKLIAERQEDPTFAGAALGMIDDEPADLGRLDDDDIGKGCSRVLDSLAPGGLVSRCMRREAFIARQAFLPQHQLGVLKQIMHRIVIAEHHIGLMDQVSGALTNVQHRMVTLRKVQSRISSHGDTRQHNPEDALFKLHGELEQVPVLSKRHRRYPQLSLLRRDWPTMVIQNNDSARTTSAPLRHKTEEGWQKICDIPNGTQVFFSNLCGKDPEETYTVVRDGTQHHGITLWSVPPQMLASAPDSYAAVMAKTTIIKSVEKGSPAERAGIKPKWKILTVAGKKVYEAMGREGAAAALRMTRDDFDVTLERPDEDEYVWINWGNPVSFQNAYTLTDEREDQEQQQKGGRSKWTGVFGDKGHQISPSKHILIPEGCESHCFCVGVALSKDMDPDNPTITIEWCDQGDGGPWPELNIPKFTQVTQEWWDGRGKCCTLVQSGLVKRGHLRHRWYSYTDVLLQIRTGLEDWVDKLSMLHDGCTQWRARANELVPECADFVRQLTDEVFARWLKSYHGSEDQDGVESWLLEACFACTPPPSGDDQQCADVREAIKAARNALARTDTLCPLRFKEAQVADLSLRLQESLCRRFCDVIGKRLQTLDRALCRAPPPSEAGGGGGGDGVPPHRQLLNSVSWAVAGREMLSQALRESFLKKLVASQPRVAAKRRELQMELEGVLGRGVGASCQAIALRSLRLLAARQRINDYHPGLPLPKGADDDSPRRLGVGMPTEACYLFCQYLSGEIEELRSALPMEHGGSLKSAFACLSKLMSRGVYAHLKGMSVSDQGAMQLKRDCTEIADTLSTLGAGAAAPFERLKDMTNVFIVPPDFIPEVVRQLRADRLADLSREDLEDFLNMRHDHKNIKAKIEEALS